jgi:hypothetical protein
MRSPVAAQCNQGKVLPPDAALAPVSPTAAVCNPEGQGAGARLEGCSHGCQAGMDGRGDVSERSELVNVDIPLVG